MRPFRRSDPTRSAPRDGRRGLARALARAAGIELSVVRAVAGAAALAGRVARPLLPPLLRLLRLLARPLGRLAPLGRAFLDGLRLTSGRIGARGAPLLAAATGAIVAGVHSADAAIRRGVETTVRAAVATWSAFVAAVDAAAEAFRPEHGAAVAALAAAVALGAAEFVDYRAVEVVTVELDRKQSGSAHAYLLLPVAIAAIAALYPAVALRRWRMGRLIAAAGAVAIAVGLGLDLPAALDEGSFAENYAGASAQVTSGFWVQLFSGATLVVAGLLLSAYLRGRERGAPSASGGARSSRMGHRGVAEGQA